MWRSLNLSSATSNESFAFLFYDVSVFFILVVIVVNFICNKMLLIVISSAVF